MSRISKDEISSALNRLGELMHAEGHVLRLGLLGGALMILRYDARPVTKDVDVVLLEPELKPEFARLSRRVAEELELDVDWINDAAKGFLAGWSQGEVVISGPGIEVFSPSLQQLLALKLAAWRDEMDVLDARMILQDLMPKMTKEQVWQEVEPFLLPGRGLKAQYAFDDLWAEISKSANS